MSGEIELLPCPFCGSHAYIAWESIFDDVGNEQIVRCSGCGASMRYPAISRWNLRAKLYERPVQRKGKICADIVESENVCDYCVNKKHSPCRDCSGTNAGDYTHFIGRRFTIVS
jgi:Lar family restriction alleviation protein